MSGIAISVIDASSVVNMIARVAFVSAIHLYRSLLTSSNSTGELRSRPA
jgi:hypothetical protein